MQHLKELGCDTSSASMFYVPKLEPKDEYVLLNIEPNPIIPYIPAFTLQDVIELLSQSFECYWDEPEAFHSSKVTIDVHYGHVNIQDMEDYENDDIEFYKKNNLLDNLFDCLVWLKENKYL